MRTHRLILQTILVTAISLLLILSSCGNNYTTDKDTPTDIMGLY